MPTPWILRQHVGKVKWQDAELVGSAAGEPGPLALASRVIRHKCIFIKR